VDFLLVYSAVQKTETRALSRFMRAAGAIIVETSTCGAELLTGLLVCFAPCWAASPQGSAGAT
jgi:hypothetical protein